MATLTDQIVDICHHCNQPIFVADADRPALRIGNVLLAPNVGTCHVGQTQVHLTKREFEILYLLAKRAGRVCSKDTIFACIWELDSEVETKIIDVFVCKLRKKLTAAGLPDTELPATHWGRGYSFGAMVQVPVA